MQCSQKNNYDGGNVHEKVMTEAVKFSSSVYNDVGMQGVYDDKLHKNKKNVNNCGKYKCFGWLVTKL